MYLFVLSLCERTFGSWTEEGNLIHNRWIGSQLGFGTAVQNIQSFLWGQDIYMGTAFFFLLSFMFASSLCKAGGEWILLSFFYTDICITMENMSTPESKYILISSIDEHHLPSSTLSQNELAAKILKMLFKNSIYVYSDLFKKIFWSTEFCDQLLSSICA